MERLDAFMARANAAYYATRDPFRDFTTSPEISQVFGELLGVWAATVWQSMGSPGRVAFVEAGPGRGTLMADARRAVQRVVPEFALAAEVHLIETSPRLRAIQAQAVPEAVWHDDFSSVPNGPLLLIANEFLDALPIRQFVRRDGRWLERFVDDSIPPARFAEVNGDVSLNPEPDGTIRETGEAAQAFVADVSRRVMAYGGAALLVDYGAGASGPGDSLQAIRDGRFADPLTAAGEADLTAHVDFAALAAVARASGAAVHGPIPQGVFLARLGLFQRTDRLARGQPPARASQLIEAARRLAEPAGGMGRLFKALCICHPSLPIPAGFAE